MENCGMSLIGSWNTLDVVFSNQVPTWPQMENRKRKQQRYTEVQFVSYIVIMISPFQKTKDNGISCSPNTAILASRKYLNAECHPRSYHAVVFHRSLHDSDKKVPIKGYYCRMMQEEEVTCNNIVKELACSLHYIRHYGCRLLKEHKYKKNKVIKIFFLVHDIEGGFLTPNRKMLAINVGRM